ncbi:hypothetical protein [Flavobacterium sp.]|uniref:hypothetical protein n=1 Tax=Flavobacterium sp. TaxID=239 RepID=UPI0038FC194F
MKILKYIIAAFQFFKGLILKSKKTEDNNENIKVKFKSLGGKLKLTSNTSLSQMYSEENETLFI